MGLPMGRALWDCPRGGRFRCLTSRAPSTGLTVLLRVLLAIPVTGSRLIWSKEPAHRVGHEAVGGLTSLKSSRNKPSQCRSPLLKV